MQRRGIVQLNLNLTKENTIMRILRYHTPSTRSFCLTNSFGRSPWGGLETEIDRLFNRTVAEAGKPAVAGRFNVDLYQDENNAYVRAELPGFKRDAISVEVVDGNLTIEATRGANEAERTTAAKLSRSLVLSDIVKADSVSAAYLDGVLTVTLPKKEEAKPQKVSVAVS
jgi:HSP20 family protein